MKPRVVAESATEPIEVADVVLNLRLDAASPEAAPGGRIAQLITAARRMCEQELEISLVAKTLEIAQESFLQVAYGSRVVARPIEFPQGPVRSIVSVIYANAEGTDTVLPADQYRISVYESSPVLRPAYNVTWPTARCDLDSVRVRYTVGYPSDDSPAEEVPEPIRQAMHLYVGHYYANREAVAEDTLAELPLGVRHLLSTYRRGLGV